MDPVARYNAIVLAAQFNLPRDVLLHRLIHVFLEDPVPLVKMRFLKAQYLDPRPEILTDADTFVYTEIDESYDYRFPGDNGFVYRRLPITAPAAQAGLDLIAPQVNFTTWDMIPQINNYFGIQLTEEDVVYEKFGLASNSFRLRIHPNSWCWFGERVLPVQFTAPTNTLMTDTGDYRVTHDFAGIRVVVPT